MIAFALFSVLILFPSSFLISAGSVVQLASNITTTNTGNIVPFNIINVIDSGFFAFDPTNSTITVKSTGDHFLMASLQVGYKDTGSRQCGKWKPFFADYWVIQDGASVQWSNVRLTSYPGKTDRIVLQMIFKGLSNGATIQIFTKGGCSETVYITTDSTEPFIPSASLSMWKI